MRCSGLADVENDDLNAAKCDVLGLRMLKLVFFTVLSIHWSTCWVSSFLRLRMLKTMIFTVFSDLSGFRFPPPTGSAPSSAVLQGSASCSWVYGQGGMGNDRSRGTLISAGPILSSP